MRRGSETVSRRTVATNHVVNTMRSAAGAEVTFDQLMEQFHEPGAGAVLLLRSSSDGAVDALAAELGL